MKKITELTEKEAKEILEFVYPDRKDIHFTKLSFEPHKSEDGKGQYVTMGGRSIIGIGFHNGQDNCILHFDNSKAVLWLYKNGYDITEQLEINKHFSEMESDIDDLCFEIYVIYQNYEDRIKNGSTFYTVENILKKLKEVNDKYYYKDYK